MSVFSRRGRPAQRGTRGAVRSGAGVWLALGLWLCLGLLLVAFGLPVLGWPALFVVDAALLVGLLIICFVLCRPAERAREEWQRTVAEASRSAGVGADRRVSDRNAE
jgi:hypothetical protein